MALYQDDPYAKSVCAIHLGTLLCRQHRSEIGLLAFYRAVAINPTIQEAWMRMGLEHAVREGEKTKALYCLDRAARIDPTSREQIRQYLIQQGNTKEAARYNPASPLPEQYPAPHGWNPEEIGRKTMKRYISDMLEGTVLYADQEIRNANYYASVADRKNLNKKNGFVRRAVSTGIEDHSPQLPAAARTGANTGGSDDVPSSPSLKRGRKRKRKKGRQRGKQRGEERGEERRDKTTPVPKVAEQEKQKKMDKQREQAPDRNSEGEDDTYSDDGW